MKIKIIIKFFLFFSIASNIAKLEANNKTQPVDINPMARSNTWQMLRFQLGYRRYPLWGEDNCTPKKNDKCIKNHRHSGSKGKFGANHFEGLDQGPMLFDSKTACEREANGLRSLYKEVPDINVYSHDYEMNGLEGNVTHHHDSFQLTKIDFIHFCFQSSTVDFNSKGLQDVWYLKAIITNKTRWPSGWDPGDCRPVKENGNCKSNHIHTSGYRNYLITNTNETSNMAMFDSKGQCELAGNQINSFLRNVSINGSYQHSHVSGNQSTSHNHVIDNMQNLTYRYRCVKAKAY